MVKKDLAFDKEIIQRFGKLHEEATPETLKRRADWKSSAQSYLAEVIILDQFSRNIYRYTVKAFSSNTQALQLSKETIKQGFD